MVQIDEEMDKQSRIEFLQAMSGYLKEAATAGQAVPQLAPLLTSMLEFGVRGFKIGKSLEGEIDAAMDKFKQMAANPQPQPNPELMKIQAEGQQFTQKLQQEAQFKQQEVQLEAWKAQQQQQAEAQADAQRNQLEAAREAQRQHYEQQMEMMRMANDKRMADMDSQITILKQLIVERTAIDVAQLSKQTQETPEQDEAANQAIQMQPILEALGQALQGLAAPRKKTVVRGQDGRISHVVEEPIQVQ